MKTLEKSVASTLRVDWIDYAKGIGIALVVVGHTLRGLIKASILPANGFVQAIDEWIYSFHMPLFFFIAGLFLYRSASRSLKAFAIQKFQVLAYPYLVWSLFQETLQVFLEKTNGSKVEALSKLWQVLYQTSLHFWFLYVLLLISLGFAIALRLRLGSIGFLGVSVALLLSQFYQVDIGPWGMLYLTRWYAIYVAIAVILGQQKAFFEWFDRLSTKAAMAIAGTGFSAIALGVALGWMHGAGNLEPAWIKPIVASVGIASTLCLSTALANANVLPELRCWGVLSLPIYLAHVIASACLRTILLKVFKVNDPTLHIAVGVAAGIYLPIALHWLSQRFQVPQVFTLRSRYS